jgi:glutathione peroxidase
MNAHDFTLPGLAGTDLPLRQFAGRAVLLVNTASRCGFTPQYTGLQTLWTEYKARGLTVLGVPCNDFGGQEPGSAAEIGAFCTARRVDFPMAGKISVRGPERHPLYAWLAAEGGLLSVPRWNFYKYLIGPDGELRGWFTSVTSAGSGRLRRAVKRTVPTA